MPCFHARARARGLNDAVSNGDDVVGHWPLRGTGYSCLRELAHGKHAVAVGDLAGALRLRELASPPSSGSFHAIVSGGVPDAASFRLAGQARVDGNVVILGDKELHSAVWCAQKVAVRGGFSTTFQVQVEPPHRGDVRWHWAGPQEVTEIVPPARIRLVLTQASVFEVAATGCCDVDTSTDVVAGRTVNRKRKRSASHGGEETHGGGRMEAADATSVAAPAGRPLSHTGGSYVFVEIAFGCASSNVVIGLVDATGVRCIGRSQCALPCMNSVNFRVVYEEGRLRFGTDSGVLFEVPADLSRHLGLRGDDGHAWVSIQCPALSTGFAVSKWDYKGLVGTAVPGETCYVCNQSEEQLHAAAVAVESAAAAAVVKSSQPVVVDGKRCCTTCTLANDISNSKCDACGTVFESSAGGARAA